MKGEAMARNLIVGIAASLLCLAVPATAQDRPDPRAIEAARELLIVTDFQTQFAQTAELTAAATIDTIMRQFQQDEGEAFPAELESQLRRILREHNDALVADIAPIALDETAILYARYFTVEEIIELARIQTHPVMMKFQRIMPQFFAEASQVGMAETVRRQPELQARIFEAINLWMERSALLEGPGI